MSNEQQYYQPGEEPISTDNLIFQIGEKEVDLYRKRRALSNLQEQLNVVLKKNQELDEYINTKLNNQEQSSNELEQEKQKNQELQEKVDNLENIKDSMNDLTKKLEKEREKNRKLREQLDE